MLLAVHYRVMEHFGSLESTQEARVARGDSRGQLLRFFRALQTSRVLRNSIVHAKSMNQLLNLVDYLIVFRQITRDKIKW